MNFMIRRIYYIKPEKTTIDKDKTFVNEYIIFKNYKFIGFFNNFISSSKKMRFVDSDSLKSGYVQDAFLYRIVKVK